MSLAMAAAACAAGCVSPFTRSVDEQRLLDTGGYVIVAGLELPATRGPDGCGAQALASVMTFDDPTLDAAALADELPWHDQGATPVDLLLAARDRGFEATLSRGSWAALDEHVRRRRPLLVMVDAAPEVRSLLFTVPTPRRMHWSVVSGMADDGSAVLLAARAGRHHVVEREAFLKRWLRSANCAIHVSRPVPPPELPAPPS